MFQQCSSSTGMNNSNEDLVFHLFGLVWSHTRDRAQKKELCCLSKPTLACGYTIRTPWHVFDKMTQGHYCRVLRCRRCKLYSKSKLPENGVFLHRCSPAGFLGTSFYRHSRAKWRAVLSPPSLFRLIILMASKRQELAYFMFENFEEYSPEIEIDLLLWRRKFLEMKIETKASAKHQTKTSASLI